jgi:hypothetical protein
MEPKIPPFEKLSLTSEQKRAVGFLTQFSKQMVVMASLEKKLEANSSELVKGIYRVCDQVVTGCLPNGKNISCKKGCYWCCYLRVKVTPLEVMCIRDYLQMNQRPEEIDALKQRFAETDEITRGMDGIGRVYVKKVCPLAVDKQCLVYPVRPIACRIYHSLSSLDCKLLLENDHHELKIRQDISGMGIGMFAGLTEGLRSVGLQTRLLELIAGLRIALNEPDLFHSWFAGYPVFSGASIENGQEIESFHQRLVFELENWY